MKFLIYLVVFFIFIGALVIAYFQTNKNIPIQRVNSPNTNPQSNNQTQDQPLTTVVVSGLDVPWAIDFLLDGSMLVTERSGSVRILDTDGTLDPKPVATIQNVKEIGEGGLLGIAVDPEFGKNNHVYFYYTYDGSGVNTLNRVVRMTYNNRTLSDEKIIVDAIPGNSNHNGGRIKFGPDGYLYITTGDAQDPSLAQNRNSLAGKILRVTKEGAPAPGNPFNTRVYSYGHRNPQGIAWDSNKTLWETEHGRSGALSGLDEVNRIEAGKNYGWDIIQGNETRSGMETPARHSGSTTWAPSGAAIIGNTLYFSGLRGRSLYEATIENGVLSEVTSHFEDEFGRIREVIAGPDGILYITTSNRDGRGDPASDDDKIIKVNPAKL